MKHIKMVLKLITSKYYCFLFYLIVSAPLHGMNVENSAHEKAKNDFAVELLNYESKRQNEPNQQQNFTQYNFQGPALSKNEDIFRTILQNLYGENITNKKLDKSYIKLLKENCPIELNNLIKKFKNCKTNNLPSRILLTGPSGCGKSSLAQVIAQRAKPLSIQIDGASFGNEYQNSGVQNLMRLFEPLLESQTEIAIIIDELTALTNKENSANKKDPDAGIVQKFWCLLDKCDERKNILVIATANNLDEVPLQIKTRFAGHTYSIGNPRYKLREKIVKYYLPDFDKFYFWQKFCLLWKTRGVSTRELKSIIQNASIYKDNDNERIYYYDVALSLAHSNKAESKFFPPLSKKIADNGYWLIPFMGSIVLHQIYTYRQELFQLQLTDMNQKFQEKMQMSMNNTNQDFQEIMNNKNQEFQKNMQEISLKHADASPTQEQMIKQGAVQVGSSLGASLVIEAFKWYFGL